MIVGCSRSIDNPSLNSNEIKRITEDQFSDFVKSHKVGEIKSGSYYWLEKQILNPDDDLWAKLVLIFGYVDNYSNCAELKAYLEKEYPSYAYRCTRANKDELQ